MARRVCGKNRVQTITKVWLKLGRAIGLLQAFLDIMVCISSSCDRRPLLDVVSPLECNAGFWIYYYWFISSPPILGQVRSKIHYLDNLRAGAAPGSLGFATM